MVTAHINGQKVAASEPLQTSPINLQTSGRAPAAGVHPFSSRRPTELQPPQVQTHLGGGVGAQGLNRDAELRQDQQVLKYLLPAPPPSCSHVLFTAALFTGSGTFWRETQTSINPES